MTATTSSAVIKQHLIDPEICIRCNTCETVCPVQAITHGSRNYVVDADKCNWCHHCIAPCPTGAIDNYRTMPRFKAYSLAEQLCWDKLPVELSAAQRAALVSEAASSGQAAAPGAIEAGVSDPTGQTTEHLTP